MATDGGLFRGLSCITLNDDIPETNSTDSSPTCNTLNINREQARQRALAGLRTWHARSLNTTASVTKQQEPNCLEMNPHVIGAGAQKQPN
jgi:hypothetical protein